MGHCGDCKWMLPVGKVKNGVQRARIDGQSMECYWVCANPANKKETPTLAEKTCKDFKDRGASKENADFRWWLSECSRRNYPEKVKKINNKRERDRLICEMHMKGVSLATISEKVGLSTSQTYEIVRQHVETGSGKYNSKDSNKEPLPYTPITSGRIDEADRAWIYRKYNEGYTQREIAAAINRSQAAVSAVVREKRK